LLGSACLFIYILAKTQLNPAAEAYDQQIEFAETVKPVESLPEWLNDFTLWNKVIAVLNGHQLRLSHFTVLFMDTSGSSPWGF